jgi:hypothetical protein
MTRRRLASLLLPSANLLHDLEIDIQAFFPDSKLHEFVNCFWRGNKNVLKIIRRERRCGELQARRFKIEVLAISRLFVA